MTTQPLGKAPTAASDVVATTVKPVNHQEAELCGTRPEGQNLRVVKVATADDLGLE